MLEVARAAAGARYAGDADPYRKERDLEADAPGEDAGRGGVSGAAGAPGARTP
ncbi:MAG TPA: hypothetical protein VFI44_13780 [Ornithinibacter sp.]|nr:hypothetical protein [Ornithinibacter sp.]